MMNKLSKTLAVGALALSAASAQATLVEVSFTGDNIIADGGLCSSMACTGGTGWSSIGTVSNLSNWRTADRVSLDLGPGTYWFAWSVENSGNNGPSNPAGFLAEILWDGYVNSSSSGWDVSTNNRSSWRAATEYGANGGTNVWTNANGGNPIDGISTSANWLWSQYNSSNEMFSSGWFRTSITIAEATAVPEPGTLALFGLGLLGAGFARRRKS